MQRLQREFAVAGALRQRPFLEFGRVAHQKALQEVAAVEIDRTLQQRDARFRRRLAGVAQCVDESRHIHDEGRVAAQRHGVARDLQERVERLAQAGERLAQVVLGVGVAHFTPQERGQGIALLCAARYCEIGEQGGRLVGNERSDRGVALADLEAAKQANVQIGRHARLQQMIPKWSLYRMGVAYHRTQ
jgi:hypothetical protein